MLIIAEPINYNYICTKLISKNYTVMARPFKFQSAEQVWSLYQNYLKDIANKPMYRNELIKSGERAGEQIPVRIDVPPNIWGFCLFADIERKTYYNYINGGEDDNIDNELIHIFTCVDDDIKQKQITGATVNLYNANIVARLNGLSDTVNLEHSGEQQTINISIGGKDIKLDR